MNMKKKISVLGSTGSIGTQTLDVAANLGCEIETLAEQLRRVRPKVKAR